MNTSPLADSSGFDVIGDIHGMGSDLVSLLRHLGYDDSRGYFRHATRQALFVGDLVDRGPEQVLSVRTVQAMVEAGTAMAVLGNHELQVIELATPHRTRPGEFLMARSERNRGLHAEFLDEVVEDSPVHVELIDWLKRLPMWLDLGELRVVHACWDQQSIESLGNDPSFTDDVLHAQVEPGTIEQRAVQNLIRGPEISVDPPWHYMGGAPIEMARFSWWRDHEGPVADLLAMPPIATLHTAENCLGIDGPPWEIADPQLPLTHAPVEPYPVDAPPLFFGHYWRNGLPSRVDLANAVCVDFSACRGGPLVAYRWSGEQRLTPLNFAWVPQPD